jgi:hypothetical protein
VSEPDESQSECGPVCISRECPCRIKSNSKQDKSKSESEGKTTGSQEDVDSDQWTTDSDSEPESSFIPNWAYTSEYFLNHPKFSKVLQRCIPTMPQALDKDLGFKGTIKLRKK